MGKVLFINFPAEGHVNPTVGLVKELTRKGEEVTYYCVEKFRERLEGAGANVRTYEDFVENEIMKKAASTGGPGPNSDLSMFMEIMLRKSHELYLTILSQVQNEKYDYVINDHMCLAGWMVAEKLGLPKITSCTSFALHPDFESPMKKLIPPDKFAEVTRMTEQWIGLMKSEHDLDLSFLRKASGFFCHPVDMTVVYTSAYFQPNSASFDGSYHFVGPSIAPRKDAPEFPLEDLKARKVVYISMGTVFNQQKHFYEMCFEAFKDLDAAIVMSVGKNTNLSEFSSTPDNFIVKNYVPQLEVLQIADVFFTHGGMNSTSEGLYYGTPLAVIPVSADQPMVARRVSELKAGLTLDLTEVSPALLRETAETLLAVPSFKQQAEAIGASFREAGGAYIAADVILQWRHASV
ncbi:macrolide family glycosyltransferase [Paenibacillus alkalitolerans]|uniref:macrolide family glycosyltransferase n=1 Tax=Paenibacillus alkalitolerans TaxID=2799335 RepID=UPI0018F2B61C|nr:macrolide family glycosyltransferase [Paenibacillus alkalitolerans]